jgi:hypothetical protein
MFLLPLFMRKIPRKEKPVYQPVMSEENVRRLYFLKQEKKKPMTKLLDQILNEYFEQHNNQNDSNEGGNEACEDVKYAETNQNSNGSKHEGITVASDTDRG